MSAIETVDVRVRTGEPYPEGVKLESLQQLLGIDPGDVRKIPVSLDNIQQFIQLQTTGRLSERLIAQLGFANLTWQMVFGPLNVDILFCGFEKEPKDISDALGTISVERTVPGNSRFLPHVYVDEVRVAGITLDSNNQKRNLAISYYGDTLQAHRLNVSVVESDDIFERLLVHPVKLPTPLIFPEYHRCAGITTLGMSQETGHRSALDSFASDRTRPLRWDTYARSVFRMQAGTENIQVTYTPRYYAKTETKPWTIALPRTLVEQPPSSTPLLQKIRSYLLPKTH